MKTFKTIHILYITIQWTWGIVQNVLALLLVLGIHAIRKDAESFYYHGSIVTRWNHPYSMGLGMFIFLGVHSHSQKYNDMILVHEYGHTIQSCILGPLFLPVIGLPSLLWAGLPILGKYRIRSNRNYTDFYPEHWASYLGEKVLQKPAVWD